jgi:hypothetical protein
MLNSEREQAYLAQAAQWKLPLPDLDVLTPAQRRRIKHKQRAHWHYRDQRCDRCRPGAKTLDPLETRAASGQVSKWTRS